jgi:phosphoglycerate dehydrogenase-like enzyme
MIQALRAGTLAGASVDVAANEPLPATDPLWNAPNLRISPHCTSLILGDAMDRIVEILIENLHRHQSRRPLINVAARPAAVSVP